MTVRHILIVASAAWVVIAVGSLVGMAALYVGSAAMRVPVAVAGLVAGVGGIAALIAVAAAFASRRRTGPITRVLADRRLDLQQALNELERYHKELAVVSRYADSCTKFQDSGELYRNLTRQMAHAVDASLCFIMRYEKSANKMVAQAPGYGVADEALRSTRYTVTPEIKSVWNFSTQGSLLSNDPLGDRRVLREISSSLGLFNCVVVPFLFHGRVAGLIVVANKAKWFTYDDVRLLTAFSSYTALAVANQQLQNEMRRTIRDGLTGLYTPHYFRTLLDQEIQAPRPAGGPLSVIAVAIDEFQACLELYGRAGADRIVKEVAGLLLGYVGTDGYVARCGAQEFLILLSRTERDDPAATAEQIRSLIEEHPVAIDTGIPFGVTVSIGVASSAGSVSSDALLHGSQHALRRARQGGKNRIVMAGAET
jgi:diguanylate cyclase (GGDEF)-like protein